MAKKAKKQTKKAPVAQVPENALPQNILLMGERVEENKNIYISQAAYKFIQKFTKNKTTDESGGMLVGTVIEEFGKTNIVISGFVEAKYCEATPTTLKFTHETWDYVHKEIDKKYKGKKILGWIHTHPDFGIFLSEYDKFIHQNFFSDVHQVAYVVDPIQHIEGFYFWINGNIEKCKGFYIYDEIGKPITVETPKDEPEEEAAEPLFSFKNILLAVMSVAIIFLIFSNISVNNRLSKLESEQAQLEMQQYNLTNSANQTLYQLQMLLSQQSVDIQELEEILIEAGIIIPEPEPTEPEPEPTEGETTEPEVTEPEVTEATEGEVTPNE